MKKILGILAICFVGLFMLVSCNDNKAVESTKTEPPISEPTTVEPTTVEPETTTPTETTPTEVNSGTVLFNLATAEEKDVKTITFTNGVEAEYIYKVELHREVDDMNFRVCATKLVQYDTYFEIEFWQAGEWGSLTCDCEEYQYTIMK